MARLLIDQMSEEEWDPTKHPNEYRRALEKLLASKRKFVVPEAKGKGKGKDSENVVDLMDALRRSVAKSGGGRAKPKKAASRRGAA